MGVIYQYDQQYSAAMAADHVVDQGTDGIWSYRRWASGISECWGTFYKYVTIASNGNLSAGVGAFPDIFISRPITTVSGGGTTNPNVFVTYSNAYKLSSGYGLDAYWRNVGSSAFNNSQAWMDIYAIGRWK